jgi:hypothetical protein
MGVRIIYDRRFDAEGSTVIITTMDQRLMPQAIHPVRGFNSRVIERYVDK